MSTAALKSPADLSAAAPAPSVAYQVTVSGDFASMRTVWDALVREGHATPYQNFGFIERFFRLVDAPEGAEAMLVMVRDPAGTPVMLLPLVLRRIGPFRVARFVGGGHANFNMPLCSPRAASLSQADLTTILKQAAHQAGADVYAFANQPETWQGFRNPLAGLGGQASPSAGYKVQLGADAENFLHQLLSKDTRRKTRQKEARLATLGDIAFKRADSVASAEPILATFFDLRAARFAAQGISDPFAGEGIRAFFRSAVMEGIEEGRSAIELHALTLNGKAVAIFGMIAGTDRISGVFTAFDADPDISKSSPGDILLIHLIGESCRRGFSTFDLGAGEAHYKSKVCQEVEPLFDSFIPATMKGHIAATVFRQAMALKRRLKQSDRGRALIALLHKIKARM